ncbi:MAG TPA: hypothetical protein P5200_10830 [Tenuifilaceae bacterium]|nr:hypothetical protein [Tenuifilaceae bacterium]
MKTDFICPKCSGHLLVGDNIVLAASTKSDKRLWLILLSPELGNYTSIFHPEFQVEKGEKVNFFCPLCHNSLAIPDVNENLVKLIMVDKYSEKHEIIFSGIEGEECTYQISEKEYKTYGDSSELYDAFFKTRHI